MFNRRAVFFDRDGTLIQIIDRPEVKEKITAPFFEKEVEFMPSVYRVLCELKAMGFLRIMVTNQPDVAKGYMQEEVWHKIQRRIADTLAMDDVFMCRHRTEDNCPFKKPSPLMLQSAADKWGIDLSRSYMVGDTSNDTLAGKSAGCGTILLDKPYNQDVTSDIRVSGLVQVLEVIKAAERL